jgi:hypothetical protein
MNSMTGIGLAFRQSEFRLWGRFPAYTNNGWPAPQFMQLGCPEAGIRDRRVTLRPGRTNFSIPGIQSDPTLPVAATVSERLEAVS